MAHYNTVLHQLLSLVPRHDFEEVVEQYRGDRYAKKFKAWSQLTVLLFSQATGKASLRDIQNAFAAQAKHLYHLGLPDKIARSTIAECNERVPWHIYRELFGRLQQRCQSMAPKHKFRFKNPLFTLDSTVIDLCVGVFPWAKLAKKQGAIKLHYGLDHSGNIPVFLNVTDGRVHDVTVAQSHWPIIPDSINCFDKGYQDFEWFRRIDEGGAYFVTRIRSNQVYRVAGQHKTPAGKGILADQIIELGLPQTAKKYPHPLRLVRYRDAETGREFDFITNNFRLAAKTIADIYKSRWQIEAFFKWIKQNLKIKSFLGTSPNAVLNQIWAAMCYVLLLAYIKFQAKCAYSLFYLHRIVGQTILARLSILDLMNLSPQRLARVGRQDPQLCLQL